MQESFIDSSSSPIKISGTPSFSLGVSSSVENFHHSVFHALHRSNTAWAVSRTDNFTFSNSSLNDITLSGTANTRPEAILLLTQLHQDQTNAFLNDYSALPNLERIRVRAERILPLVKSLENNQKILDKENQRSFKMILSMPSKEREQNIPKFILAFARVLAQIAREIKDPERVRALKEWQKDAEIPVRQARQKELDLEDPERMR